MLVSRSHVASAVALSCSAFRLSYSLVLELASAAAVALLLVFRALLLAPLAPAAGSSVLVGFPVSVAMCRSLDVSFVAYSSASCVVHGPDHVRPATHAHEGRALPPSNCVPPRLSGEALRHCAADLALRNLTFCRTAVDSTDSRRTRACSVSAVLSASRRASCSFLAAASPLDQLAADTSPAICT